MSRRELPTVPVTLRVHLAHATVQAIADDSRADILHIKGPAVAQELRPEGRESVDADVLVRPSHLRQFLHGLQEHGWQQVTVLRSGGLVEHSTNWYHGELGQMDVHVRFPGIQAEAERAFERLWQGRTRREIAGHPCVVPDLTAQRLLLLLHAARDVPRYGADIAAAWHDATPEQRRNVQALAQELRADVALAAATGRLEEYRHRPEYGLWRLYVDGTITEAGFSRIVAEIRAAPEGSERTRRRVIGYVVRALVHMPARLEGQLGRKASLREVAAAYATFIRRGTDLILHRGR